MGVCRKGGASQAAEKRSNAIILSEAKDLHWFVFKEILQMLRCAQHDRRPFSAACSAPPKPRLPPLVRPAPPTACGCKLWGGARDSETIVMGLKRRG